MQTKLIRVGRCLVLKPQHGVVTIGNFDGVHLGHQRLLLSAVQKAKTLKAPVSVLTFEPHPSEYFARLAIPRLSSLREKFTLLAEFGVDYVLVLPFNKKLAELSASEFVQQFLIQELHARHIVVGDDFHFGRARLGDHQLLSAMGKQFDFTVCALPTVKVDDERVSSTRIRAALQAGDLVLAKRLLGRSYCIQGRVSHGDKRGREWGFPTANIDCSTRALTLRGVYTVYVHGITNQPLPGVANMGMRPTVDGTKALLEVHLLNFAEDIYGHHIKVEFCKKLRDEERYASFDLLKQQIARDVCVAKNYFEEKCKTGDL